MTIEKYSTKATKASIIEREPLKEGMGLEF